MTLCKKFLLLLPLLNRIDSILSFCRTIIFMVLPVLVLPQIFKMDGEWPSISAGEMLSLAMSICGGHQIQVRPTPQKSHRNL